MFKKLKKNFFFCPEQGSNPGNLGKTCSLNHWTHSDAPLPFPFERSSGMGSVLLHLRCLISNRRTHSGSWSVRVMLMGWGSFCGRDSRLGFCRSVFAFLWFPCEIGQVVELLSLLFLIWRQEGWTRWSLRSPSNLTARTSHCISLGSSNIYHSANAG